MIIFLVVCGVVFLKYSNVEPPDLTWIYFRTANSGGSGTNEARTTPENEVA